jgi:hypothetical protein
MLQRFRDRFGTAGLIVAVVALAAALAGTAIAAGGLTGKQKKEVTKIAKKYAGKPGATGPQGPAGPQGPKGDTGAQGEKGAKGDPGTNGTNGTNGTSATAASFAPGEHGCTEGGIEVKSSSPTAYVCNGEEGSPWTAGGTLPSGETETGVFVSPGSFKPAPISFAIPLAQPLDSAHVVTVLKEQSDHEEISPGVFGEVPAECEDPGHVGNAGYENPEADAGYLCIFVGNQKELVPFVGPPYPGSGTSVAGAEVASTETLTGTWAVTG